MSTAWAATAYEFYRSQVWRAPQVAPVELGLLSIRIDPLVAGTHQALFSLPPEFELADLPAKVASLENQHVELVIRPVGDREIVGEIEAADAGVKATFLINLRSTIPSGHTGDIELTVMAIQGQLLDGVVTVGAVWPGELAIKVQGVSPGG